MKFFVLSAVAATALADPAHDIERMRMIEEINSTPGITWKAAMNDRFKGLDNHAPKDFYGVKPDNKDRVNALPKVQLEDWGLTAEAIPDTFDSETNWPACATIIGEIRDQSNCGCCWAFAGASAASDRLCIATNGAIAVPLSAQETCFCSNSDGCNGGYVDVPWIYIKKTGLTTGGLYNNTGALGGGWCSKFSLPHCHHHGPQGNDPYPAEGEPGCPSQSSPSCPTKCDSDSVAPHNDFATDKYTFSGSTSNYYGESSIQTAIMTDGPVEAAFTVYADFENYAGGVYKHTSGSALGGHAIRIVGWGVDSGMKYWKVANSWNPYWGEKGYFRIARGTDDCGIESQVAASSTGAKWFKK